MVPRGAPSQPGALISDTILLEPPSQEFQVLQYDYSTSARLSSGYFIYFLSRQIEFVCFQLL